MTNCRPAMRWSVSTGSWVQLESKNELRARLGRSPDRADALALAFAGEVAVPAFSSFRVTF